MHQDEATSSVTANWFLDHLTQKCCLSVVSIRHGFNKWHGVNASPSLASLPGEAIGRVIVFCSLLYRCLIPRGLAWRSLPREPNEAWRPWLPLPTVRRSAACALLWISSQLLFLLRGVVAKHYLRKTSSPDEPCQTRQEAIERLTYDFIGCLPRILRLTLKGPQKSKPQTKCHYRGK